MSDTTAVGNTYETTVLDPAIKESVKATMAKYTAAEVITERSEVSLKCKEELQNKVSKYGIVIDDFNITNLNYFQSINKVF